MTLKIKQGETLSWSVEDDSGDISGTVIEAALLGNGFYQTLVITPIDLTVGTYEISATDTSGFPTGSLSCDIRYTAGGIVVATDTFYVEVLKGVTRT
ncbi:hypothetical protein EOK75_17210 (plasmid) [Pseudorhodobacter turbinis]|uniref:Bacterial Ig-like domain-containing protein n=1 Tax=Pseudorhodobacter turbinis TaxID=2500533 RepID=A0A4P8EKN4_9RHOB|nr:hypothetical protein [Pseudorhodobacter turbinis]QCO57452.1 hypothetical protein EOK75_17210 [Pseudorhodobacter turbinis]